MGEKPLRGKSILTAPRAQLSNEIKYLAAPKPRVSE